METTLKEKCKNQQKTTDYYVDADKWVLAHLDGRCFSKNVKKIFDRPFDKRFINIMNAVATYLCEEVQGAQIAYVQSDEISILLKKNTPEGDIFFGGRLCKMESIMASIASVCFYKNFLKEMGGVYDNSNAPLFQFDCKVWAVDNSNDALAWFLFRNIDCIRNSKLQTAQSVLSHREMMNKTSDEAIILMKKKSGIDWETYADGEKYGRLIYRRPEEYISKDTGEKYVRNKFIAIGGMDLTLSENRDKLKEMCNAFKTE